MRVAKLLTFYVLPLIALTVYFFPAEREVEFESTAYRSIAQRLVDQYDSNSDRLLSSYEIPIMKFQEIDCNNDFVITEREIQYFIDVKSKNLIGDLAYYDAMPAAGTRRPRPEMADPEYLLQTQYKWYLR